MFGFQRKLRLSTSTTLSHCMYRLFSTAAGLVIERHGAFFTAPTAFTLDTLFTSTDPRALLGGALATAQTTTEPASVSLLAPVRSQEVWAAGVTYYRSRSARMAESTDASGGTFYDKVYEADRPEIFFKATPHRVAAPNTGVRIRADSKWNVPEPELTLAITSAGKIFGYTLGNDMSSRDIEGENPLYLPQAKVYDRSAALGPCLVVTEALPAADAVVALEIRRTG